MTIKKPLNWGFLCTIFDDYGFTVVAVALDVLALPLSLLVELSDAFFAKRAAAIAEQPASKSVIESAEPSLGLRGNHMYRNILLIVCCAFMSVRIASAEIVSDQSEDIDQVLILNAAKAALKPAKTPGTWEIIIKPQVGNLVTSKPTVAFRTVYGKTVSDHWTGWFEDKPTPAVLTWQDKKGEHGAVLEVDQPRYSNGTLRFTGWLAPHADGTLDSFSQFEGNQPQQGTVKQVALYLDDTQARVIRSSASAALGQTINGCVIEPAMSCPGADLAGADLAGEDLPYANLPSANLSGANLTGVKFDSAELKEAKLIGANLSNAKIIFTDMRSANLSNAKLVEAYLDMAILLHVNLSGADLTNASLTKVSTNGAVFCKTIMPSGSINNSGC